MAPEHAPLWAENDVRRLPMFRRLVLDRYISGGPAVMATDSSVRSSSSSSSSSPPLSVDQAKQAVAAKQTIASVAAHVDTCSDDNGDDIGMNTSDDDDDVPVVPNKKRRCTGGKSPMAQVYPYVYIAIVFFDSLY